MSEPGDVVVVPDEFGILVQGPADEVEDVVQGLLSGLAADPTSRTRLAASDVVAAGATGVALAMTAGEYLRLAPESVARLKELGLTFDGPGVARRAGGQVAAHLNFEPVSLAAEQALALQTAAVSLALRSAIAQVHDAVERVEDKVDRINTMLSARLQGDVIGTYRELLRVVTATNRNGFLRPEDWDGVASTRLKISQDLETMRTFIHTQAGALRGEDSVPRREARLEGLTEPGHVADVLNLIVVAEKALQLYEYLRIQAVRRRNPAEVPDVLTEARTALAAQRDRDQDLVRVLRAAVERVRVIGPLEVHHVLSKRGLDAQARLLDATITRFAEASVLRPPDPLGEMPEASWSDARDELRSRVQGTGRAARELGTSAARTGKESATQQARRTRERLRRRAPSEPADDSPADLRTEPPDTQPTNDSSRVKH